MGLYRIHTKSICHPDDRWLAAMKADCICPGYGCNEIYPHLRSQGVDVCVEERPDIAAINCVSMPGVSIARRDFLDLFADEVSKYLKLGRVFTSDGELLDGYVTFIGQRRLLLRGGAQSRFFGVCKTCGHARYWPGYPWYVLRGSFVEQPLYESCGVNGLIVTEELKGRIEKGKWKGIRITKLPIVDKAKDGIKEMTEPLLV